MIVLVTSLNASAQFENAVWDTLTADTLQDALTAQAIAVNGYEEFHLTYSKHRAGGGWNIYYRYFDIYDGMYPEVVAESSMPCHGPVIASRYGDDVYDIAIFFESGEDIWGCINQDPQGQWEFSNVTNSADPDLSPSVAVGSNDIHVAWITHTNSQYKISYMRGHGDSSWTEIIQDSELGDFGAGAQPFIVANGDIPHIFYRGVNGQGYHIHHAYRIHPDSIWQIEYLMTGNMDDYSASAVRDLLGNVHLAISGNDGWGMPSHVYYMWRGHETGEWSSPLLVTGQYSASNASIFVRPGDIACVASCGVSGNVYDGNVYLSDNSSGSFQTQLLRTYLSCTQPVITDVIGEYGVLIFDAPIGSEEGRNIELVYYGPNLQPVGVREPLPSSPVASYCYPNPFNSRTTIEFDIENPAEVTLDIFDITGRKIATILDDTFQPGNHSVMWDAGNLSSGVYFYRLQAGDFRQTHKMVLLK